MTMTRFFSIARFCAVAAVIAGAAAGIGCRDNDAASMTPPTPDTAEPTTRIDSRSQHDLARAIELADSSEEPQLAYDQLRKDWLEHRMRWTVYRIAPLCRSADSCNVLPFDRTGRDAKVVQGWMPRLELGDDDLRAIESRCGDQPRCEIQFEGTVSQLVLSVDQPTSLTFSNVDIVGATTASR